jgi:hypothetical protein
MKNSETDRELNDLIKGALDNYEEQYILGSWENFVRIREKRKKRIVLYACTGVAASLLLGWLGLRFILSGTFINDVDWQKKNASNLVIPSGKDTLKEYTMPGQGRSISAENIKSNRGITDKTLKLSVGPQKKVQKQMMNLDSLNNLNASLLATSGSIPDNSLSGNSLAKPEPDTASKVISSAGGTADKISSDNEGQRADTVLNKPDYRHAEVMTTPDNKPDVNNRTQKFRFGVNISPGVTSTSTASSYNYSGGVNADYELSRSFRLSTGLQVEHQNVINESSDAPAWIPSGQTQADLVDIDLPLNLTWKFLIRKSSCYYLAGGISSVIYLSENYTSTSYTQKMVGTVEMNNGVPAVGYQLENVISIEREAEAPLSTFDFAGRINIILGFEQHLSSRVFLHFEPYIKIPVSEQATQNLKFTTSGITCKVSF